MTFTIPVWLLWVIGVPLGLLILVAAFFGVVCFFAFKDFSL